LERLLERMTGREASGEDEWMRGWAIGLGVSIFVFFYLYGAVRFRLERRTPKCSIPVIARSDLDALKCPEQNGDRERKLPNMPYEELIKLKEEDTPSVLKKELFLLSKISTIFNFDQIYLTKY
jgi:hypothetical protein